MTDPAPAETAAGPPPARHRVQMRVNGLEITRDLEPRTLLVHFLREDLGLTGTHVGCDTSDCGACTVHLDGRPVKSCTVLAVQANGREVRTIEGLAANGELSTVQRAFVDAHGLQCGFCTPGMIMTATALLERRPDPSESEIREAIRGNLCRCTGYANIVRAVQRAATLRHAAERDAAVPGPGTPPGS